MRPSTIFAAAALLALLPARPADACAPAFPAGASVRIADEAAILIWDAAAKTEHFIRRATFTTTAADFGFLVPTPSRPELAEAPDAVFYRLESMIRPPVVYRTVFDGVEPGLLCAAPFYLPSLGAVIDAAAPPVRVLETKLVAGYEAAILEADSASALAEWLKSNGYASRPALEEWLKPYVDAAWKITAFKIAGGEGAKAVATSAVRMSFKTDKPFFPYREPADQREVRPANVPDAKAAEPPPSRLLRVFFIGEQRASGAIGQSSAPWPGETVYADAFSTVGVESDLAPLTLPSSEAWLTTFEDRSNPRPGTDDVFFTMSAKSSAVRPAPVEVARETPLFLPLDVLALLIGGAVWIVKRRRKRRDEARGR